MQVILVNCVLTWLIQEMGHWVKIKKEPSLPDLMTLHIYAVSVVRDWTTQPAQALQERYM